jgi:hypothetical protein
LACGLDGYCGPLFRISDTFLVSRVFTTTSFIMSAHLFLRITAHVPLVDLRCMVSPAVFYLLRLSHHHIKMASLHQLSLRKSQVLPNSSVYRVAGGAKRQRV